MPHVAKIAQFLEKRGWVGRDNNWWKGSTDFYPPRGTRGRWTMVRTQEIHLCTDCWGITDESKDMTYESHFILTGTTVAEFISVFYESGPEL
jgi:hypothetical protein